MLIKRIRLRYGSKLFWSHLLAIFLVSGSVGTFFYISAMDNLMHSLLSRLQNSAALLSQSIDVRELEAIREPADAKRDAYQNNIAKLRRIRRANPDIAFLYVMRKDGNRVTFVLDSDETERQALPGREYTEMTASMLTGFYSPSVDDKPYRDEWGVFLSGYAPLLNGEGRYLLGIDMRADEVANKLAQLRLIGIMSLLAALLLALLFARFLSRGLARRIEVLVRRCRQIATGQFETRTEVHTFDEFDDLIEEFNTMSAELERERGEIGKAMQELRDARDDLEKRVQERTHDLQQALDKVIVLRGLLPICCSCKKIRNDQGYWQQVEQFVEAYTDARFTHGICPECALKLYGAIVSEETHVPSDVCGKSVSD